MEQIPLPKFPCPYPVNGYAFGYFGKTFLIREFSRDEVVFALTGLLIADQSAAGERNVESPVGGGHAIPDGGRI